MADVYSGQGTYDPTTNVATYTVYLPKLQKGSYKIHHDTIYNFSCENDKDTILIFMSILNENGEPEPNLNVNLSGTTTDPGETFDFSLRKFTNIATDCIDIVPANRPIIDVIIMHDYKLDKTYAKDKLYMGNGIEKIRKIDENPKKHGFGTLRPSK